MSASGTTQSTDDTLPNFMSEALKAQGHVPRNAGYVPMFHSSVYLDLEVSRGFVSWMTGAAASVPGDELQSDQNAPWLPMDVHAYAVIAHELTHALMNRTTATGLLISVLAERTTLTAMRLMRALPDRVGDRQSLLKAALADEQLAPLARSYLADRGMLGYYFEGSRIEPIEGGLVPVAVEVDADGHSFLCLSEDGVPGSVRRKVRLDYRLISENLAASVESVLFQQFPEAIEVRDPVARLPPHLLVKQWSTDHRYYILLTLYIQHRLATHRQARGTLNMLIKEMLLLYATPQFHTKMQAIPFGHLLEALIEIVNQPDCPQVSFVTNDGWLAFRTYVHDKVSSVFPGIHHSFEGMIEELKELGAELEDARFGPLWHRQREGTSFLASARLEFSFFAPRLAFDRSMCRGLLLSAGISVYGRHFSILSRRVLDAAYGLDSSEFDCLIVEALMDGTRVGCPRNRFGICTGILAGFACNDGDVAPSEHPCGFFDHRREIRHLAGVGCDGFKPPSRNLRDLLGMLEMSNHLVSLIDANLAVYTQPELWRSK